MATTAGMAGQSLPSEPLTSSVVDSRRSSSTAPAIAGEEGGGGGDDGGGGSLVGDAAHAGERPVRDWSPEDLAAHIEAHTGELRMHALVLWLPRTLAA